MKKTWHKIIALIICAICTFGTACSSQGNSGSSGSSGSAAPVEPDGYYVTEFSVLTPPTKTSYVAGEKFDYTGMVLKAVWNDGEVEEIGAYECDEILPKGALTKDVTQMTFKYYGNETTQTITVEEVEVLGLTIDTSKIYTRVVKDSIVNLNDIVVTVNYSGERQEVITDYEITENEKTIETPSRYQVTQGAHVIQIEYLGAKETFTLTGFNGSKFQFGKDSVSSSLTEATVENPIFVESANVVKNFSGSNWTETTSVGYSASESEGITDIKANAIIKIHFYSEKATYAKLSMNAATYYLMFPAQGTIYPMDLTKTFSSITLNGVSVEIKESVLPGGTGWLRVFADVDLTEGWLKQGDNLLTITVDDYYWNSKYDESERRGNQLYGETEISIKSLTFEEMEGVAPVVNSIAITKKPNKTEYTENESFDPTGMEVTAYYNDGSSKVVTDYVYSTSPLQKDDTEVLVTYEEKSAIVEVRVQHEHKADGDWIQTDKEHYKLCSVCHKEKVSSGTHDYTTQWTLIAPSKLNYSTGETLDLTGMKLSATCSVCGEIDATEKATLSSLVAPAPDANGKSIITVTYGEVEKSFEVIVSRIEVQAGWGTSAKPNGSNTKSFFLNKDGLSDLGSYSMQKDVCASFKQGAKMRFYVLSDKEGNAKLSFKASCGNGEVQANQLFDMRLYKLTNETQAISDATAINIAIADSVKFGYKSSPDYLVAWNDYSHELEVGIVSLQEGWNVIEVEFKKGVDINFKSIILDFVQ